MTAGFIQTQTAPHYSQSRGSFHGTQANFMTALTTRRSKFRNKTCKPSAQRFSAFWNRCFFNSFYGQSHQHFPKRLILFVKNDEQKNTMRDESVIEIEAANVPHDNGGKSSHENENINTGESDLEIENSTEGKAKKKLDFVTTRRACLQLFLVSMGTVVIALFDPPPQNQVETSDNETDSEEMTAEERRKRNHIIRFGTWLLFLVSKYLFPIGEQLFQGLL